ncbi:MAG: sugar ABC transporter permease [Anaerolineaceae bacterium]|nr:sugar ABC transporter permease [Anaerolineaceae bacterium]MDE0328169.1 sugar ABC transporter permease [Anaerolineaceae bacterium]
MDRPVTSSRASVRNDLVAYAFMAPYLVLFILFLLLPAIVGIYASFTKWGIIGEPQWVGLRNYDKLINSEIFIESLQNTLYFVILAAIPLIVLGFLLALLVHQKLRFRNIARAIVFLPHVVSVAAVGIIFQWILERSSGLLNYYLGVLGVNPPINWLGEPESAMPAIAITTIWWTVNGNMIIYLAGLQDIPETLYESARIDGASGWQLTRHITIPMLLPISAFVIPLTVIACWRVFGQVFVMTRGGPQGATFTVAQFIYETAFVRFNMGLASAAGVILMLITLGFTVVQLRAMKVI